MIGNVGTVNIPKLDLGKLPESKDSGPSLTKSLDKAPPLGFFNAIKIGFQAFGQSLFGDKDYSTIRTALKKEIIDSKTETRTERMQEKFTGTEQQKTTQNAELKDKSLARELKLDTGPTVLFQTLALDEAKGMKMKTQADAKRMDTSHILPEPKLSGNPEKIKAHFANLVDRIVQELDSKAVPKEMQLNVFKDVFTRFVVENTSVKDMMKLNLSDFDTAARSFKSENRTEKHDFVNIMKDTLGKLSDPKSDVALKIKEMGFKQLNQQLGNLKPTGETNFLRDKFCDQFNMHILINGANKVGEETTNFIGSLLKNEKFKELSALTKSLMGDEDKPKSVTFKSPQMTPDMINLMGDLSVQLLDSLAKNENFADFRKVLGEITNVFVESAASGKVSEEVAQRGNKIFGDSSILLRFVIPVVVTGKIEGGKEDAIALKLLGSFTQLIANRTTRAPGEYDDSTQMAFLNQNAVVQTKIEDFLSSLNVPTSEQLTQSITKKKNEAKVDELVTSMDSLVNALPEVPQDQGKEDVKKVSGTPVKPVFTTEIDEMLSELGISYDGNTDEVQLSKQDLELLKELEESIDDFVPSPKQTSVKGGSGNDS